MECFEGPEYHNAYVQWLATNPDGFVLHFNIGDTVLHRATCHHIGGRGNRPTNGRRWTFYRKECSASRADLKASAAKRATEFAEEAYECETCHA